MGKFLQAILNLFRRSPQSSPSSTTIPPPVPPPAPVPTVSPTPPPAISSPPPPPNIATPLDRFVAALPVLRLRGFDPYIVLAHAWHETGGFKHMVGLNNYFGITLPKGWTGKVKDVQTHEFYRFKGTNINDALVAAKKEWPAGTKFEISENSKDTILIRIAVSRKFADWDSTEEALVFYASKIQQMYPAAYSWRNVPEKFFQGLMSGKFQWATDPSYVAATTSVYRTVTALALVREKMDSALA